MQDDYLERGGGLSLEMEAGDLKQGEEVDSGMTFVGGGGGHEIERGMPPQTGLGESGMWVG